LVRPAASGRRFEELLELLTRYAIDAEGAVDGLLTDAKWSRRSIEDNVRVCMPMMSSAGDASPCDTRRRALAAARP